MDLSEYKTLTGLTVSSSKVRYMSNQITRTQSMLETMLGFTLDPAKVDENLYNELGKTSTECTCPSAAIEGDLEDPDDVTGAYRLFPFNKLDQYIHIDPFTEIYNVKLVYVKKGADNNGVTLKTFTDSQVRVDIGRDGIGKYLEICRECQCDCNCENCLQLAVDADWLWDGTTDEIPDELKFVWADMVTHYSDRKRNIKSENITTHSYTKFDNVTPENEPHNLQLLKKYAGPFGSIVPQPTTGAQGRRVSSWLT